jgi:hypothetical protein
LFQLLDISTLTIMLGQLNTTRTKTSLTVFTIDWNATFFSTTLAGH